MSTYNVCSFFFPLNSELLDKVSQEIESLPQCKGMENIVDQSFRGEIVSQVRWSSRGDDSRDSQVR